MSKVWFIIPARMGSKRFPFKNRNLVPICISNLKESWLKKTIISTDDDHIKNLAISSGIKVHNRSKKNSSDNASMRDTLQEVIADMSIADKDTVVCLYPTYPERTSDAVESGIKFFNDSKSSSMLCKKDISTHPFLCLEDVGENKGKPFIETDLYRWQDFPKCFQYSHFIVILKAGDIVNLNSQLFNSETVYLNISDPVDVDNVSDFENYLSRIEKKPS